MNKLSVNVYFYSSTQRWVLNDIITKRMGTENKKYYSHNAIRDISIAKLLA